MHELFSCKLIETKPVLIMLTDGTQDEAPRYPKSTTVTIFTERKLDVLLHGVNAFGLSE